MAALADRLETNHIPSLPTRPMLSRRLLSLSPARLAPLALAIAAVLASAATPADPSSPDVLVSRQLADAEGLDVGSEIRLSASRTGEDAQAFRVAGIYEPVPDPVRLGAQRLEVRLHLPDLLTLRAQPDDPAATERIDSLSVALTGGADADAFARVVSERSPGLVAVPMARISRDDGVFVVLDRFHLAIAIVTVLASTVFLLALMIMRADERREQTGIMRLIGFSRRHVLGEALVEGLFIALAGAIAGVLFAAASQGLINLFFQWYYDTALVFVRVTPEIAWRCVAIAAPAGVLAGFVATWALVRREITALIRR